ncbi:MAG: cytosolic protein [Deltaproteobacteria bacterium]|nr:cytosolic protein [Deltaproteobacteria bacterium]
MAQIIGQADDEVLIRLVMDAFRRTLVHYGFWYAEVEHQLGMEKAFQVERKVWSASSANQMKRLGKVLGFAVEADGTPARLKKLSREELLELLKNLGVNWLANDGIWFQAVEFEHGMIDAKRCNDSCWTRYSPYEAERIKELLELPENGGIPALKKALAFRMYALINRQSIEDVDDRCIIFRMNECRVQLARQRKGLDDYPCKSVGLVEYPYFARTIDSRIKTECLGCPPDPHPDEWFCAWKFTLEE